MFRSALSQMLCWTKTTSLLVMEPQRTILVFSTWSPKGIHWFCLMKTSAQNLNIVLGIRLVGWNSPRGSVSFLLDLYVASHKRMHYILLLWFLRYLCWQRKMTQHRNEILFLFFVLFENDLQHLNQINSYDRVGLNLWRLNHSFTSVYTI